LGEKKKKNGNHKEVSEKTKKEVRIWGRVGDTFRLGKPGGRD